MTIDAVGCQVETPNKIVDHKANCLYALKGNPPTLPAEIAEYCRTTPKDKLTIKITVGKGYGRIKSRTYPLQECRLDRFPSQLHRPAAFLQHPAPSYGGELNRICRPVRCSIRAPMSANLLCSPRHRAPSDGCQRPLGNENYASSPPCRVWR